jgi:CRISPR type IV-associated protein Csf2
MRIRGTIRLTSPLLITSTAQGRVTLDGRLTFGDAPGSFPCTTQYRFSANLGGVNVRVPVIPANTWRGSLRRAAAERIKAALIRKKQRISLPAWSCLLNGAASGNPDSGALNIQDVVTATSNVYLGVFGGGPRFVHGGLSASISWPLVHALRDAGIINAAPDECISAFIPDTGSERVMHGLTSYYHLRRSDDLSFCRADSYDHIEGGLERIADWLRLYHQRRDDDAVPAEGDAADGDEGTKDTKRNKKTKGDAQARGTGTLTFAEAISPGVPMSIRFDTHGLTPAQNGLVLRALLDVFAKQRIGANGRLGFGRFGYSFLVEDDNGSSEVRGGPDTHPQSLPDHLTAMLSAADEAIESLTATEIDAMFAISSTAVANAKAKLIKAGASAETLAAYDRVYGHGR